MCSCNHHATRVGSTDSQLQQQQEEDELLAQFLQFEEPTDSPSAQMACHSDFLSEPLKDVGIQCNSCYEVVPVAAGIACTTTTAAATVGSTTSHFACDDCMSRYVASVVSATAAPYQQLARDKGCINCPILPCTSTAFHPQAIAAHVTQAVHDSYLNALRLGNESLLVPKLEADYERRLQDLKDTLQSTATTAVSSINDTVRLAEMHVNENIVTLKCPKCTQGFYDFEGKQRKNLNISRCNLYDAVLLCKNDSITSSHNSIFIYTTTLHLPLHQSADVSTMH
jgi:predicted RNA-binding Zn-ribbon protein involved in translation (DUF1610 family)